MDIFWFILIGMTAGWLAGYFMTGKGFGAIGDLTAGVIGALIGGRHRLGTGWTRINFL